VINAQPPDIRSIITVGICPCWDLTCRVDGIDWGEHKQISSQTFIAAGKAFNISRALAWLKSPNIAAGLWGRGDYQQMLEQTQHLADFVDIKLTPIKGRTRYNVTVVDTHLNKEIHLRAGSELADSQALKQLSQDLGKIVDAGSVCVFAGSMPQPPLLDEVINIADALRKQGCKIAIDTSGPALRRFVESGRLWLIKPNTDELCELLGRQVKDTEQALAQAGRELCDSAEIVVISRAAKGAILVTKQTALQAGVVEGDQQVVTSTVGCGDYLLAGLLYGFKEKGCFDFALETAVKVATAKAHGQAPDIPFCELADKIKVALHTVG